MTPYCYNKRQNPSYGLFGSIFIKLFHLTAIPDLKAGTYFARFFSVVSQYFPKTQRDPGMISARKINFLSIKTLSVACGKKLVQSLVFTLNFLPVNASPCLLVSWASQHISLSCFVSTTYTWWHLSPTLLGGSHVDDSVEDNVQRKGPCAHPACWPH